MMRQTIVGLAALLLAAGVVAAQPAPPAAPEAPMAPMAPMACGMRDGGQEHSCSMGHGMQGGCSIGHGMQGGCGMGHGMQCGCGMGQGMRGGCGSMGRGGEMGGCGPMGRGGMRGILQHREALELTDKQVEQIEQMRADHQLTMIDRRANLEKAELRLRTLMQQKDVPARDVETAIDQVAQLRADMQKARYKHQQQCLSVLTDAQREKLEQMRAERQNARHDQQKQMQQEKQNFRGRRF